MPRSGTTGHLAPCRNDGALHTAPAPCRQPSDGTSDMPRHLQPAPLYRHGALTVPAKQHLRKSVPMRPCFVNPGFGTAARHTPPGRLGLMRRNRQSQRFSPALRAFLARQNCRARRSSTTFPPQGVRRARPSRGRNHQGRDGRGLATQEIHHG